MPFVPMDVFADRAARIQTYLGERDLCAFIVTTPDNFFMVSGFLLDVAPWERPVAAVIPREGDPFLVMNELSTNHLLMAAERGSLFIGDYAIYTEHPRWQNRTYSRAQWGELLALQLKERGITGGTLAVEGSGPGALKIAEPAFGFVDATPFLVEMREVKYPAELAIMRECAALTDFGQDRYMEHVKPGKNVAAFDHEIAAVMIEEAARRFPADHFQVRMRGQSGPASASPHGTGADCGAVFERGHGVVNIIIGNLSGLTVENERTLFVGPPNDQQRAAFAVATEACEAAAAQMVAGNLVSSADAAAQAVIERAGFGANINHRTGHGMGIAGHEFPDDMPVLHRPFKEREVYSAEPGIYIYGLGGFRHDDSVVVGAETPEVLTKRSKRIEDQTVAV